MHYCAYSFADLFLAANGRVATDQENEKFNRLTQVERNAVVKKLAKQASWETEKVKTIEGRFIAFWPPA
ncbi:MAG: hypothetical protein WEC81_01900 [Patescibacteria group bacterium]